VLNPDETAALVLAALDRSEIPHMVAGSHASSYHGNPRSTNDIDLVIAPRTRRSLVEFAEGLPADRFYASAFAAEEAFRTRGLFNVIDMQTGVKVDLVLRKNRPFSESKFTRRRPARIFGVPVFVATPEDTILAKLEWAKLGESERQLRDVAGVLAVRGAGLDRAYLERWVAALGLADAWRRAQELAASSE
jgi:hypothetical protein